MEGALRDYINSFNSLQSVKWASDYIAPSSHLGRRVEGEEWSCVQLTAPRSGPESHVLCATAAAAAARIPASTVWTAHTVTLGVVVDAGCTQLCGNTT